MSDHFYGKRPKPEDCVVTEESKPTPCPQRSVHLHDGPPASYNKHERKKWYRLFGRPLQQPKKKRRVESHQTTEYNLKPNEPELSSKKRKLDSSSKALEEERSSKKRRHSTPHQHQVDSKGRTGKEEKVLHKHKKKVKAIVKEKVKEAATNVSNKPLRHEQVKCLGFPNKGQTCYMNSCLQSLLSLEDFVSSISCQENVWSLIPDAEIVSSLMAIKKAHSSADRRQKIHLLKDFKKAVSSWAPEFEDDGQKDAHEFLSTVLEQIRGLGPQLQMLADSMDQTYTCPVEENMVFKMENTRTCKSVHLDDGPPASYNKHERKKWYRLFGRPLQQPKKKRRVESHQTTEYNLKPNEPELSSKKRKLDSSSKALEEERSPKKRRHSTPHQHQVDSKGRTGKEEKVLHKHKKKVKAIVKEKVKEAATNRHKQVRCLGFPNKGQTCYMNSCLQSLLSLEDFVSSISRQENVWSLIPDAEIVSSLMAIKKAHSSADRRQKIHLLKDFKKAVSSWAPEFKDDGQKDAHEFLSTVLEQIRGLGPKLQMLADSMDQTYTCPVEENMVFKMENTRTCKSCGAGSTRQEEYTNLSLDLAPGGGTIEEMLQNYVKETDLEYRCECGADMSGQRASFATLPKVLVLHLKRIRYTASYQLEKVQDPVDLFRELEIPSNKGGRRYSLVSAINHLGRNAGCGHYICDSVDPDLSAGDPTDRWITFNDAEVTSTSGATVCERQRQNAYVLFYRRQD